MRVVLLVGQGQYSQSKSKLALRGRLFACGFDIQQHERDENTKISQFIVHCENEKSHLLVS